MIFSPFVDLIIRLHAGLSPSPERPRRASVALQAQYGPVRYRHEFVNDAFYILLTALCKTLQKFSKAPGSAVDWRFGRVRRGGCTHERAKKRQQKTRGELAF
jgi:hypothetical protein